MRIVRMRPGGPAAVLALALAALPVAGQVPEPHVVRPTATPCLNVRAEPNTDAEPEQCIPPGTQVTVIEAVPFWRRIVLADSSDGWSAKKFLEPVATISPTSGPVTIPADAFLEVHFVDVGQGDAIWIHTHDDGIDGNGVFEGTNVLIDGGRQSSDHTNQLLFYLEDRAHHNAVIDAAILTHPHIDHYPGLDGIRRHFDVHRYYDPGFPGTSSYDAFLEAMEDETVAGGDPIEMHLGLDQFGSLGYWGRELEAEFLYSWPGAASDDDLGSGNTLENNSSIVLRLQYGEHVFLFMGDAEGKDRDDEPDSAQYVERRLLDQYPDSVLKATVLKVGHHGSETSSTNEFIAVVDPEIVVVQSGRQSFNGTFIPDATTLQRYCTHDPTTQIYRTDQNDEADGLTASNDEDGDHIVIRTNGQMIEVEAWEGGEEFHPAGC